MALHYKNIMNIYYSPINKYFSYKNPQQNYKCYWNGQFVFKMQIIGAMLIYVCVCLCVQLLTSFP